MAKKDKDIIKVLIAYTVLLYILCQIFPVNK